MKKELEKFQGWIVGNSEGDLEHPFYSTLDYEKFVIEKENRAINMKFVSELAEEIRNNNLLPGFPILVDQFFRVKDGQHRLKAAELLGVPIFYIFAPSKMAAPEVARVNRHNRQWKPEDYLRLWIAQNVNDYIQLDRFQKRFDFLSINVCRFLLSGNPQRTDGSFERGVFTINRQKLATDVAKVLSDFIPYVKNKRGSDGRILAIYSTFQFAYSVLLMVENPLYDHKRMLGRLMYQPLKLQRCADTKAYLALFSEIYNYSMKKDRVDF